MINSKSDSTINSTHKTSDQHKEDIDLFMASLEEKLNEKLHYKTREYNFNFQEGLP